jgi:uncharacterized phage infection (PIP) family protein YhgE
MTSPARVAVLCAAVLSLVAGVGCGGDTKASNNYVDAINKAQTDFAANIHKLGSGTSTSSDPAQAAKDTFAKLDTAIKKVVADLKAVKPPDKVKDLHSELIGELNDFEAQVKTAGASLGSGDPQAIVKAQSKFAASASSLGTRISQTIDKINKKLHG